jgi:hypothetical protein
VAASNAETANECFCGCDGWQAPVGKDHDPGPLKGFTRDPVPHSHLPGYRRPLAA